MIRVEWTTQKLKTSHFVAGIVLAVFPSSEINLKQYKKIGNNITLNNGLEVLPSLVAFGKILNLEKKKRIEMSSVFSAFLGTLYLVKHL